MKKFLATLGLGTVFLLAVIFVPYFVGKLLLLYCSYTSGWIVNSVLDVWGIGWTVLGGAVALVALLVLPFAMAYLIVCWVSKDS